MLKSVAIMFCIVPLISKTSDSSTETRSFGSAGLRRVGSRVDPPRAGDASRGIPSPPLVEASGALDDREASPSEPLRSE